MNVELESLMEGSRFLEEHSKQIVKEPFPIYKLVVHARNHVDTLLEAELRKEAA